MQYLRTFLIVCFISIPLLVVMTFGQENIFLTLAMVPFIAGIPYVLRKTQKESIERMRVTMQGENGNWKIGADGSREIGSWGLFVFPFLSTFIVCFFMNVFLMEKIHPYYLLGGEYLFSALLMSEFLRRFYLVSSAFANKRVRIRARIIVFITPMIPITIALIASLGFL